ncbi:MAG: hypothetical protein WDN75_21140 [Bacteroidota bacterium]
MTQRQMMIIFYNANDLVFLDRYTLVFLRLFMLVIFSPMAFSGDSNPSDLAAVSLMMSLSTSDHFFEHISGVKLVPALNEIPNRWR